MECWCGLSSREERDRDKFGRGQEQEIKSSIRGVLGSR